ncbi:hypothetical protein TREMEDRAFT_63250 [Tremella mesenterica DSM 1558]|uniref:uncharacterized protein n=1 Tax=Tremella mesenterica (strain ATCC 24925 / CBS 8224 / DSM 1558 / NBRC 9311 / NRRL Y-6157 / RJB 2259-6 / UBC 559-6) TaxID=578456 RepID=UPI0003F4A633|nr:uncharacterized protein TREMEDRAFT_63250 [Tremella mesenterica DSM 1558]EIW68788.1 hypothetical protein TREMEDRAFT_63250 [Tremella mesenterica DSM 1558]
MLQMPVHLILPLYFAVVLEPMRKGHPEQPQDPPPCIEVNGQEEYIVNQILDSRIGADNASMTHGNPGKMSTTPQHIKASVNNTLRIPLIISLQAKQTVRIHIKQQKTTTKDLSVGHQGSEDFALRGGAPVMNDTIK